MFIEYRVLSPASSHVVHSTIAREGSYVERSVTLETFKKSDQNYYFLRRRII